MSVGCYVRYKLGYIGNLSNFCTANAFIRTSLTDKHQLPLLVVHTQCFKRKAS